MLACCQVLTSRAFTVGTDSPHRLTSHAGAYVTVTLPLNCAYSRKRREDYHFKERHIIYGIISVKGVHKSIVNIE